MRAFSLTRVPLLFMCSPKVTRMDDERCEVIIPFRKIVKNHLNSMYFGALAIGADTCVGFLAFDKIQKSKKNISLVFKDFQVNFVKRAEADTLFVCEAGAAIDELIREVITTGERHHKTIPAKAFAKGELVAEFALTLSLKLK